MVPLPTRARQRRARISSRYGTRWLAHHDEGGAPGSDEGVEQHRGSTDEGRPERTTTAPAVLALLGEEQAADEHLGDPGKEDAKEGEVVERIGCSSLRGGGGELGTNKNLDLWLQLVCTKLKLKHACATRLF